MLKMSEFNSQEPSERRKELLAKLNDLKDAYSTLKIPNVSNEISDDQLEIMYLKYVKKISSTEHHDPGYNIPKDRIELMESIFPSLHLQKNNK